MESAAVHAVAVHGGGAQRAHHPARTILRHEQDPGVAGAAEERGHGAAAAAAAAATAAATAAAAAASSEGEGGGRRGDRGDLGRNVELPRRGADEQSAAGCLGGYLRRVGGERQFLGQFDQVEPRDGYSKGPEGDDRGEEPATASQLAATNPRVDEEQSVDRPTVPKLEEDACAEVGAGQQRGRELQGAVGERGQAGAREARAGAHRRPQPVTVRQGSKRRRQRSTHVPAHAPLHLQSREQRRGQHPRLDQARS